MPTFAVAYEVVVLLSMRIYLAPKSIVSKGAKVMPGGAWSPGATLEIGKKDYPIRQFKRGLGLQLSILIG